jgi:hypothetical protein
MIVVERFQAIILINEFDSISELLASLARVMPYTILLITIFPINAAIVRLDRYWQKYLSHDLAHGIENFYGGEENLPLTDYSYDLFNNRMDVMNKLLYYTAFISFPLSFTLPFPDNFIPLILGLVTFVLQGYQSGWWLDIQDRVKVKTIFDDNNENNRHEASL